MKMKKTLSLLLASALSLSLLAGCGGNGGQSAGGSKSNQPSGGSSQGGTSQGASGKQYDGVTINMWSMWSSGEPQANVIEEAAAAFKEQTGATVNIEFKGRDVNKVLTASLEAKEAIDIIEDDYQRM